MNRGDQARLHSAGWSCLGLQYLGVNHTEDRLAYHLHLYCAFSVKCVLQRGYPRSEHRCQVQLEQCQGQSLGLQEGLETSGQGGKVARVCWVETSKKMFQLLPVCQGSTNCSLSVGQICLLPVFAQSLKLRMVLTFFKELFKKKKKTLKG